jgi:hypothetical protein
VFDESNGSQVEQVDLDELDDEEAPCVALRNMFIGDVCTKKSEEPPQAPTCVSGVWLLRLYPTGLIAGGLPRT